MQTIPFKSIFEINWADWFRLLVTSELDSRLSEVMVLQDRYELRVTNSIGISKTSKLTSHIQQPICRQGKWYSMRPLAHQRHPMEIFDKNYQRPFPHLDKGGLLRLNIVPYLVFISIFTCNGCNLFFIEQKIFWKPASGDSTLEVYSTLASAPYGVKVNPVHTFPCWNTLPPSVWNRAISYQKPSIFSELYDSAANGFLHWCCAFTDNTTDNTATNFILQIFFDFFLLNFRNESYLNSNDIWSVFLFSLCLVLEVYRNTRSGYQGNVNDFVRDLISCPDNHHVHDYPNGILVIKQWINMQ